MSLGEGKLQQWAEWLINERRRTGKVTATVAEEGGERVYPRGCCVGRGDLEEVTGMDLVVAGKSVIDPESGTCWRQRGRENWI